MGTAHSPPLTSRAAVRVNDTLQMLSLISKHRLISLVSYCVCECAAFGLLSQLWSLQQALKDIIAFAEVCLDE